MGEIIDIRTPWDRHVLIVKLRNDAMQTFLELGKELYDFDNDGCWQKLEYASMKSYLADPDVDIGVDVGYKLMRVYERWQFELRVDARQLLPAGYSKLDMVVPHTTEENHIGNLAQAQTLSQSDLRIWINETFKGQSETTDKPILSAFVGENSELLPLILDLYVPAGGRVADVTYGEGTFWKEIDFDDYEFLASDIEPRGRAIEADFGNLPYETNSIDALIFDPPYKLTGTPEETDQYRNETGGYKNVQQFYEAGIGEAARVLKEGGLLIVKCMDQVVSGKQQWYHKKVYDIAMPYAMLAEDLFVLVRPTATPQPHARQLHARKNHSFFWVFRKE